MSLMRALNVTMNADAIAKGVLAMMRERYAVSGDTEDNADLIRMGLLPARWMNMLERQMDSVIRERFQLLPNAKGPHNTIVADDTGEDGFRCVEFTAKELVAEMVHEVTLRLYGNVEMVV